MNDEIATLTHEALWVDNQSLLAKVAVARRVIALVRDDLVNGADWDLAIRESIHQWDQLDGGR